MGPGEEMSGVVSKRLRASIFDGTGDCGAIGRIDSNDGLQHFSFVTAPCSIPREYVVSINILFLRVGLH